jgi:hypothetical protein
MTEPNPRASIGDNKPPPDPIKVRTDELVAAANKWGATDIKDQDNADALSAFIDQLRAQEKLVEEKRKTEKKPHIDAADAVDAEWNPLKALLDKSKKMVMPRLDAWLLKLKEKKEEDDRRAKAEADRLAKIAAEAAEKAAQEAAQDGDVISASVAAEAAEKAAQEAAKTAQKQASQPVNFKSSLGARTKSLRTYWHARVTSHMAALAHFKNHPDVIAVVARLAEQAAGEKAAPIPGVEFYSESKAA